MNKIATDLEKIKGELNSEPTTQQVFEAELATTRDGPISASAPVPPTSFAFGQATTTLTQAPRHPPHKTFTEVEVNLQLIAAKAEARCKADREISALSTKLEHSKKESHASKVELGTAKAELEMARKELRWTRETLVGAEIQQDATNASIDKIATDLEKIKAELNSEPTIQQVFEAELATTRDALFASDEKWYSGPAVALLKLLPALLVLMCTVHLSHLVRSTWTSIPLPQAVVSGIDSAHTYPEMSECMTMCYHGWFDAEKGRGREKENDEQAV